MNTISRVIYFIGGLIVGILGLRFIFVLFGANPLNGFVQFIYDLSWPLVRPFFGIFGFDPVYGAARLEMGTLVAIIVYALLTMLFAGLFSSFGRDRVYRV